MRCSRAAWMGSRSLGATINCTKPATAGMHTRGMCIVVMVLLMGECLPLGETAPEVALSFDRQCHVMCMRATPDACTHRWGAGKKDDADFAAMCVMVGCVHPLCVNAIMAAVPNF